MNVEAETAQAETGPQGLIVRSVLFWRFCFTCLNMDFMYVGVSSSTCVECSFVQMWERTMEYILMNETLL